MVNTQLLLLFIPTMFFISITPGMCMTLAMSLGMTVGIKRTLWMMAGEVVGVALIAILAGAGVATIMIQFPTAFTVFKILGGMYLFWLGIEMWRSRGKLALTDSNVATAAQMTRKSLIAQGFMTAIFNPKGWAFFIAILPPFIDPELSFAPQMAALVVILMLSEFICMMLYALGGKSLKSLLSKGQNIRLVNRLAGTLMMGVGVWLASS